MFIIVKYLFNNVAHTTCNRVNVINLKGYCTYQYAQIFTKRPTPKSRKKHQLFNRYILSSSAHSYGAVELFFCDFSVGLLVKICS